MFNVDYEEKGRDRIDKWFTYHLFKVHKYTDFTRQDLLDMDGYLKYELSSDWGGKEEFIKLAGRTYPKGHLVVYIPDYQTVYEYMGGKIITHIAKSKIQDAITQMQRKNHLLCEVRNKYRESIVSILGEDNGNNY